MENIKLSKPLRIIKTTVHLEYSVIIRIWHGTTKHFTLSHSVFYHNEYRPQSESRLLYWQLI